MTPPRGLLLTFFTIATGAIGAIVPGSLDAQDAGTRRPIELGMDAALSYESQDNVSATAFTLPVTRVRAGFFLSDALSLEPAVAFRYARVTVENPITGDDRTESGSSYDLTLGLLYHFRPDRTQSQPYIRPFVGISGFTGDGPSGSQVSLGGAFGMKIPLADRIGSRIEAGYIRRLEDEPRFPSENVLFLGFGLSFFTR
jgi:hypothetical protein